MAWISFLLQILFEGTVTGIPQRVLGSASYQVGKMDVLNVSCSTGLHTHSSSNAPKRLAEHLLCFLRELRLSSSSSCSMTAACWQPTSRTSGGCDTSYHSCWETMEY